MVQHDPKSSADGGARAPRRGPRRTLRLVTAAVVVATSGLIGADVASAEPTPPSAQDVRDARRAVDTAARSVTRQISRVRMRSSKSCGGTEIVADDIG